MTTKQKLTNFIKKRPGLIWWVKDYAALDAAAKERWCKKVDTIFYFGIIMQ